MMTEQQSKQLWDYHNSVEIANSEYAGCERRFERTLKSGATRKVLLDSFKDLRQRRFIADVCQRDYDELKRELKV
jgi:hypothetical protein